MKPRLTCPPFSRDVFDQSGAATITCPSENGFVADLKPHDCARWSFEILGHVYDQVGPALAVQLLAAAVSPRAGLAMRVIAKRQQRSDVAIRAQPHIAAATAVTTVRAALRHV